MNNEINMICKNTIWRSIAICIDIYLWICIFHKKFNEKKTRNLRLVAFHIWWSNHVFVVCAAFVCAVFVCAVFACMLWVFYVYVICVYSVHFPSEQARPKPLPIIQATPQPQMCVLLLTASNILLQYVSGKL